MNITSLLSNINSWNDFNETNMNVRCDWKNYNLLDLNNYKKYIKL